MKEYEWSTDYEIGDEVIDHQHMQLLEFINMLIIAVKIEAEDAIVKEAFNMLFNYTKTHFKDEEEIFRKINSPLLQEHMEEHIQLTREVEDLWQDDMLGFRDNALDQIRNWVEKRLVPHMIISDQNAKNAGQST